DTQEEISKKTFTDRYKKIYDSFEVDDLTIESDYEDGDTEPDEDGTVQLPFNIKMKTVAGPVSFTEKATMMKEEKEEDEQDWYINWHSKMIFPEISDENIGVYKKNEPAERGEIIDREGEPLAANGNAIQIGIWP